MVQIKPADADRTLARPDPNARVVLIYGSDEGLVAERAERFTEAVLGRNADDFSKLRLESSDIAEDQGRLADEAHAVPLFGGTRVIRVRVAGNRPIDKAVTAILRQPPKDAWIVLTAGELRKTAPLRKLAEGDKGAWAVPCYSDDDRGLDRIIDEEIAASGQAISAEARTALKGLLGSDRMISRSEIRKLCLYATGGGEISIADVRALIGDAGAFDVDETIDAMATGDSAGLDRGFRRLISSGTPGFVVAGAALRHFNFLEKARAALENGDQPEAIVRRAVPPLFFARQSAVARQIAAWPPNRISRALSLLDQAMLQSRLNGALSDEVIGQAMQLIAAIAPAPRR